MTTLTDDIARLLDGLRLPPRIHATVLTGRDVVTGETLAYPVVWADRTYRTCGQCHQPVPMDTGDRCPVTLDTGAGQGGRIEEWSQQHGCGSWNPVLWAEVQVDVTDPDADLSIEAAGRELERRRNVELEQQREVIRRRVTRDLRWAMEQLSEPLEDWETPDDRIAAVSSGSELGPGVYLDADRRAWVSWDFDPETDDGADTIDAAAEAVTYGQAAAMLGLHRTRVQRLAHSGKLDTHPDGGVTVASVLRRRDDRSGQGRP